MISKRYVAGKCNMGDKCRFRHVRGKDKGDESLGGKGRKKRREGKGRKES